MCLKIGFSHFQSDPTSANHQLFLHDDYCNWPCLIQLIFVNCFNHKETSHTSGNSNKRCSNIKLNDTLQNDNQQILLCFFYYTLLSQKYNFLNVILLNAVQCNVILLIVILLNAILLIVILLNVILLNAILFNLMLNVILLNFVLRNVKAPVKQLMIDGFSHLAMSLMQHYSMPP